MKTYGTILIGCGHIGLEHIAEIHYRENVNLVACVDINPDAARMAAHRYGAQTFGTDYRPFLERDDGAGVVAGEPDLRLPRVDDIGLEDPVRSHDRALRENDPDLIVSGADISLETHLMVFAAERSRREKRTVPMDELRLED